MKTINIGILGCGIVGEGVAKLLLENHRLISSRSGINLNLKKVADIDTKKNRNVEFLDGVLINDANEIINEPEIDIIVEMIGGVTVAKDFILNAIEKKKHIVTANKALIANHGNEILKKASEKNIDIAYEASVGGCMPIIKTLRESLISNHVKSINGILNGTCNYILSKISNEGIPFEDALAKAQENGFAEADPIFDIEGIDTAHKLAILTAISYGMEINFKDIFVEGISKITSLDITFAKEFGYIIKLLAISKNKGDFIEARVHPTMIPFDNLLSNVNGSLNAVNISGDAVNDILLYGHGAGMMPTASAVISDIVDIARNIITGASPGRIPNLSYPFENIKKIPVMPIEEISTNYYFRFSAEDKPGVLSKISGILGKNEISIETVHQKGRKKAGSVPIVMLTHKAKEKNIRNALKEISSQPIISDDPIVIRIEENLKHE